MKKYTLLKRFIEGIFVGIGMAVGITLITTFNAFLLSISL